MYMRVAAKRLFVAVVACALLVGIGGSLATAQSNSETGNGFRVSPVRNEFTIEKGQSETFTVTVENPTDANVIAEAIVNDFVASDSENGEPRLILDENAPAPRNSFKSLVGDLPDLQLGPRQKKDLPVTITIPENANAGGYYGAVRFLPRTGEGDGNVALTASVGTIVLVRVPGDLTEKLNLEELSAGANGKTKSFFTGGDVSVIARLKNVGDIHVQPFGKVQVKNMFGKVVKEYELNATEPRANVLPDSIRKFEDSIEKPKPFWFGRYTITANLGFSQGSGDLVTAKASFWYLPVWFLVLLLVLIVAIVGTVFWLRGRGGSGRSKRIRRY